VWLAEGHQNERVIDVTRAFSNFFRTSLSRGKDWIPVSEEIDHVRSYLTIQGIRYGDILDYSVDFDQEMARSPVLKLLLQPLVENALYHGIKNKRGRGSLAVRGWKESGLLCFSVRDNGIGMTDERLAEVLAQVNGTSEPSAPSSIYGLYNVGKRLRLYYSGAASLAIESAWREGTLVTFKVPEVASDV
jgi:two-component system sensor histidine kinase YesM